MEEQINQNSQQKQSVEKIDRREALKIIAAWGLVSFTGIGTLAACIEQEAEDVAGKTPNTVPPVAEMRATLAAQSSSVRATSEAMSPEKLKQELEKIPETLARSSHMIYPMYYKEKGSKEIELPISGTATLIDYDEKRGVYTGLTASHNLINSQNREFAGLSFVQPHLDRDFVAIDIKFEIDQSVSTDTSIAVFTFKFSNIGEDETVETYGLENVDIGYIPTEGELLYSLGFPAAAENTKNIWPITFKKVSSGYTTVLDKITEMQTTDALISSGMSGAAVVNENGKLIGILPSSNPVGGEMSPLNNTFWKLQKNLVASYPIKKE